MWRRRVSGSVPGSGRWRGCTRRLRTPRSAAPTLCGTPTSSARQPRRWRRHPCWRSFDEPDSLIAKAELHVHLEGTAPPALIRTLAERNGLPVPEGVFDGPDRFAYTDFLDFLGTYDRAAGVIRTAEDYRDVTYEYLASCALDGAIYVELIVSPQHAALVNLDSEEHLNAIARGIDDAREDHAIEARILLTAIRDLGAEEASRVARYAASRPHPYVAGFQMAGD